jgi:O-acetyl-ADP-ribose deacetylase (regulator of RNase III)
MENKFLDGKVVVTVGDITEQNVDAVVNAANSTLLGGGGVDGAIHRKGGAQITEECRKIRQTRFPQGLPTSAAVITSGGNLKARFVIHTVGPIYGQHAGAEAELLAHSYRNCLSLAHEYSLETIAFPSISTGAYNYPKHEAAKVVSGEISDFLTENATVKEIRLVFFSESDAKMFVKHQTFPAG